MAVVAALIHAIRRRVPPPMVWSPAFNRFTLATVLSGVADALVAVSLAGSLFFSLSPDASRQQVLLYLLINMAPFALLAPLVGPVIDRFRLGHRWLAAILFAVRVACAAALAFTLLDLALYFFALSLLICGKAYGVVRQALVPELVDEADQLVVRQLPTGPPQRDRRRRRRGDRRWRARPHPPPDDHPRPRLRVVRRRRRREPDAAEHHPQRRGDPGRRVRGAARPDHRRHVVGVHGDPRRRRVLRVRAGVRPAPHERAGVDVRGGDRRLRRRHVRRQRRGPAAAATLRRGPPHGWRPRRAGRRAGVQRPRPVTSDRAAGVVGARRRRGRRPPGLRRDGPDARPDGDARPLVRPLRDPVPARLGRRRGGRDGHRHPDPLQPGRARRLPAAGGRAVRERPARGPRRPRRGSLRSDRGGPPADRPRRRVAPPRPRSPRRHRARRRRRPRPRHRARAVDRRDHPPRRPARGSHVDVAPRHARGRVGDGPRQLARRPPRRWLRRHRRSSSPRPSQPSRTTAAPEAAQDSSGGTTDSDVTVHCDDRLPIVSTTLDESTSER